MESPFRKVDVTAATFWRLLAFVVLVFLWLYLWQWVLLFIAAAFLAIVLDPVVLWLERRGLRRSYAGPAVVLTITAALGVFFYFAGASLIAEGRYLTRSVQDLERTIRQSLPPGLRRLLPLLGPDDAQLGTWATTAGRAIVNGLMSAIIALFLTVYLLIDGRRTYQWFVAFAPLRQRDRLQRTAADARTRIFAYMRGNIITSLICFVATWIALALMGVPAAMLLAVLAGLSDFVPVIGFIVTAIPAVALGLTVSVPVGLGVAAFYAAYNFIESYYISPLVYGRELELSALAVIAAFIVGAQLGGVIGALIALPIAAVYPVIETLWLADRLGPEVVKDHRRIEQSEEH